MKYILTILTIFLTIINSIGQSCDCNCEQPIPDTTALNIYLNVTGAANDDLNNINQGVCEVCVSFQHSLLPDLEMELTSPSGQSVMLIGDSQIATQTSSTAFSTFNICFVPASVFSSPFGATNSTWTNDDVWPAFSSNVIGTYYPHNGSLEDFNVGTVNGTWTLGIVDGIEEDDGQLLQFSITFCDPIGVDCFPCEADAGEFTNNNIDICREDSSLVYSFEPVFLNGQPDPDDYNYISFITHQDTLIAYGDTFDFDLFPLMSYEICGLSYLRYDSTFLPDLSTPITVSMLEEMLVGVTPLICGDITNECVKVNLHDSIPDVYLIDTLCLGVCTTVGFTSYCHTGNYNDTLTSEYGCDSIVFLDLLVLNPVDTFIYRIICPGDSLVIFDTVLYDQGNYTIEDVSSIGCDSVVYIDLDVFSVLDDTTDLYACFGDSIEFFGGVYYTDSVLDSILTSQEGCDSLVFFKLNFLDIIERITFDTICFYDTIMIGVSKYFESGIYHDSLVTISGCDSVITTNLFVNPFFDEIVIESICEGDTMIFNGYPYFETVNIVDTLNNEYGCDSIFHFYLTVDPVFVVNLNEIICYGDSFQMGGVYYFDSGVYKDTLSAENGCDSNLTLFLFASPIEINQLNETICSGSSHVFGGTEHMDSGIFFDTLQNVLGCDSILNLILNVLPPDQDTIYQNICLGDSILFGDAYYSIFGLYKDSLKTVDNCDSLAYMRLDVFAPNGSSSDLTLCQQDSILFGGVYLYIEGVYYDTLDNVNGCDSVIELNLDYLPSFLKIVDTVICLGESVSYGANEYTLPGNYLDTIVTSSGCDSVFDLTLSYFSDGYFTYFDTLCLGDTIIFLNEEYLLPGIYFDTILTSNGCDSIIDIDIFQRNYYDIVEFDTFCLGSQYVFNDIMITIAGIYFDTIVGLNTCDSVVKLNLSEKVCDIDMDLVAFLDGCGGAGGLDVTLLGGQTPFSFVITGQNTAFQIIGTFNDFETTLNNVPFDNYFMQIQDFNGDIVDGYIVIGFEGGFSLDSVVLAEYNGLNTSCFGIDDGEIEIFTSNAVPPVLYTIGDFVSMNPIISGLEPGWHFIDIVDDLGCHIVDSVFIDSQLEMDPVILTEDPLCAINDFGSIKILDIFPGYTPISISVNGDEFEAISQMDNLIPGDYNIVIRDSLGCLFDTLVTINEPLPLFVELLESYQVDLGDYVFVEAFVIGLPADIDSVIWSVPYDLTCDSCLEASFLPLETANFSIQVIDSNGCVAYANSVVYVKADQPVFVPTVFTPNGDGTNDFFQLFPQNNVDVFLSLDIFNRWGEHLFSADNFHAGDVIGKWNGTHNGKLMNPGVYMYIARVQLKNGFVIKLEGDMTLLR